MNQTNDYAHKLARTMAAQQMSINIYRVTSDDIEEMLAERPDLIKKLEGLDLEALSDDILNAIGRIGILEQIRQAMAETIESTAAVTASGGDMVAISPSVLKKLDLRIDGLKRKVDALDAIISRPFDAVGSYVTGRSNWSRSLDRRLNPENDRRAKAFRDLRDARQELNYLRNLRAGYTAGEVHRNGQPRADAPSRLKRESQEATYAQFLRTLLKPGDLVALVARPDSRLKVERVNRKTVSINGNTWDLPEILPLNSTGEPMETKELAVLFKAWQQKEGAPWL